jgi:hypothetical protein
VKILFFSPFANIWEHSFPEALVGESFAKAGMDVVNVRCGTLYQVHCVAMSASGVGLDAPLSLRKQVCTACIKRRDLIDTEMNLPQIVMDDRLTADDYARADEVIAGATLDNWTKLELDDIPVGRFAVYEMWLNLKLTNTDFTPEVWAQYLGQLRNTVLTSLAARRILSVERPDAVVGYNDHYSVIRAFAATAESMGIPTYSVHGGHHMVRRSETLMMTSYHHTMEDTFASPAWQEFRAQPIGPADVALVGDHFQGLLAASSAFAYSSKFEGTRPSETRQRLGVRQGSPVLLATMSSEDEQIGLRLIGVVPQAVGMTSLFKDQFEWIEFLLELAASRPDLTLILRLHPRMLPNKREQVTSPVVALVQEMRARAPQNVIFNEPSDGIGLYDVMQIVDVLLNFRSTVGSELAAMGIPVVVPANNEFFTYPSELNRIAHTTDEFRALVDGAIRDGWSLENARPAFRWFAFLFGRMSVDFSDVVSSRPNPVRPRKPGLALRFYNRAVYLFLQFGPLLRERLALQRRDVSSVSSSILKDVIGSKLMNTAESSLWPRTGATIDAETSLLEDYFRTLLTTRWQHIDDDDSLAGRVRDHLTVAAEAS